MIKKIESANEKVQVGNDQERAQSEKRFPLQKPRWEKTNLTTRYCVGGIKLRAVIACPRQVYHGTCY